MEQFASELTIQTHGEGFTNITQKINAWIRGKEISQGILILYTKHTSCSLTINENADPDVLKDLSSYMKALVPEEGFTSISGKGCKHSYLHSNEGMDDMPAHIRTTLTSTSLSLSIQEGRLSLGTWQAIYLWEHRGSSFTRKICIHSIGDIKSKQDT